MSDVIDGRGRHGNHVSGRNHSAFVDISGMRFGALTAISVVGTRPLQGVAWSVRCDCGKELTALGKKLRSGAIRSCGHRPSTSQRFWSKVDKTDGCWQWTGHLSVDGYGVFWISHGKRMFASRYSLEEATGVKLGDRYACHRCDNPRCVRPDHLFAGTQADNIRDMVAKGRHRASTMTRCRYGHEFDGENTRLYRGRRYCKQCQGNRNSKRGH